MAYKVLITEDDEVTARLTEKIIERLGHKSVGIATNGSQAVQMSSEKKPDIVLMDISLPGEIDGIKATDTIMHENSIPVIYVSGMTDTKTMERVLSSHPFGYLPKPVNPDILNTVVELAIQRHRLEQQLIKNRNELVILNNQLEVKIEERTSELREKNKNLTEEVTRRRRSEAQLKVALATEKELNELKSRIVSIISHEIKTPLTSVKGSAELIEMYLDSDAGRDKIYKHLNNIKQSVNSLTNLISETLLVSKMDSGKYEPKSEPLNLKEELHTIIDQIENGYSDKHSIILDIDSNVPDIIISDSLLINQIFSNLISNAVKYSPDTEIVEVELSRKNNSLVFKVKDYGIGIPDKDKKYLFEMFHRASNTSKIGGTGLGLSIVKRSVEQLKGEVRFTSEIDKGTEFVVELPLADVKENA